MDAATLAQAMPGLTITRAQQLVSGCNQALILGKMFTTRRASMFLAQVGEESGSLKYTQELASGSEYEGRQDLGNTQAGDGTRFKGRSFIQITGRSNYTKFSQWAYSLSLVSSPDYFVKNSAMLAQDQFAWLGPVWYWTVARPNLNALADAADIISATKEINGGLNGLADRTKRWQICLSLGAAVLPYNPPSNGDEVGMATLSELESLLVKYQGLTPADIGAISVAAARGGSLYMTFPQAKNPSAIYRDEGAFIRFIPAADFNFLVQRYGGPPYVVSMPNTSIFYSIPIAPGTIDPRK